MNLMNCDLLGKELKEIMEQVNNINLDDNDSVRFEYDEEEHRWKMRRDISFKYTISLKGAGSESFGKTKFDCLRDNDSKCTFKDMLEKLNSSGTEYKITIYLCPENLSHLDNDYRDKDYVVRVVKNKLEEYISAKLSDFSIIDVDYNGHIPIKELNNYR